MIKRIFLIAMLSTLIAVGARALSVDFRPHFPPGGPPFENSPTPPATVVSTNRPVPSGTQRGGFPFPPHRGFFTPTLPPTLVTSAVQQPSPAATVNPPAPVQPALAAQPVQHRFVKAGTIITMVPPVDIALGQTFALGGTLRDWSGYVVPDVSVQFSINGAYLGQTRTDSKGQFAFTSNKVLDAGIYAITASFNGTHLFSFSSTATTLKVQPTDVKVQTVPPVAGVTFQLNDSQFITGEDGSASMKVNKAGVYRLQAMVDQYSDPTQRIEFGRWLEDDYQPFKDIQVPTGGIIPVGLNIYNLVGQSFVDLDGLPVDPSRITQFTIRSEQGDTFVFNNGDPRWIPSSRITRRIGGLVVTKMLYSVISVKIDGSNVVNASQQQFYAEPNDNWKISLLLYGLQIKVNDGLFGSSVGRSVNVFYPDGQVKNYQLDRTGFTEIHGLARGNYSIQAVGVRGVGTKMPVALSRNQLASMKILTYIDLGIVGIFGILVALALLLYGRRTSLLSAVKKQRQKPPAYEHPLLEVDDILPADRKNVPPKDEPIKWS